LDLILIQVPEDSLYSLPRCQTVLSNEIWSDGTVRQRHRVVLASTDEHTVDDLDKSLLLFITHTCTELGIKLPCKWHEPLV